MPPALEVTTSEAGAIFFEPAVSSGSARSGGLGADEDGCEGCLRGWGALAEVALGQVGGSGSEVVHSRLLGLN